MTRTIHTSSELRHKLTHSPVVFTHEMHKHELFSDEKLAEVIEKARAAGVQFYTLGALANDGSSDRLQSGALADFSGKRILETIRNGRLWLQIQHLDELAPDYHALSRQAYSELEETAEGFDFHKLTSNLLISSPQAVVPCHIDCAEVTLFHIRGRKRFFLYDLDSGKFASDETVEAVVLRETEEDIPYSRDWDDQAMIIDLEPGMAANFPHFWPHKVENLSGLNVSLQTEFYTARGVKRLGVRFANGVIRRRLGLAPKSCDINGPLALAKASLGLAAKKLGINKPHEREIRLGFRLDPDQQHGIAMIDEALQQAANK